MCLHALFRKLVKDLPPQEIEPQRARHKTTMGENKKGSPPAAVNKYTSTAATDPSENKRALVH